MTSPQFIQLYQHNAAAVAQELLQGLSAPQAFTSPKYLYDALGSRLFEAITELPEYDLTRTEAQLMQLLIIYIIILKSFNIITRTS